MFPKIGAKDLYRQKNYNRMTRAKKIGGHKNTGTRISPGNDLSQQKLVRRYNVAFFRIVCQYNYRCEGMLIFRRSLLLEDLFWMSLFQEVELNRLRGGNESLALIG